MSAHITPPAGAQKIEADLVVVNERVRVRMTIVDGRVVFEK